MVEWGTLGIPRNKSAGTVTGTSTSVGTLSDLPGFQDRAPELHFHQWRTRGNGETALGPNRAAPVKLSPCARCRSL